MKLTRKELYDLVWSEPMSIVCKKFGMSDNGLRKHCKSMNIPTPPIGYWAKLKHGKPVKKTPLPNDYEGKKQNVELHEVAPNTINNLEPPVNKQQEREKELQEENTEYYIVPPVLYAKDPLIIDTKEKYRPNDREGEINTYLEKNPYTSKIKEALNLYVSADSLDRGLRIFYTVIKALEFRGHTIKIEKDCTYALIEEEKIEISLTERRKQVLYENGYGTDFCGELSFNIHHQWRHSEKTSIKDTKYTRLEDKIHSIIAHLEIKAQERKEERIEEEIRRKKREEEEKRREEFKAKQKAELKEFRKLFKMSERLYKANLIRDYIYTYEHYLEQQEIMDPEVQEKLQWAKDKADWLDPFISKEDIYLDSFSKDDIIQSEPLTQSPLINRSSLEDRTASTFWDKPWWKRKKKR